MSTCKNASRNPVRRLAALVVRLPGLGLIGLVRLYQVTLSPLIGRQCRFHPTCSNYFIESVKKHGAIRGAVRGILRICRCHPWHPGGFDPP
jgi:putative membrane protein insertion efficiency factor